MCDYRGICFGACRRKSKAPQSLMRSGEFCHLLHFSVAYHTADIYALAIFSNGFKANVRCKSGDKVAAFGHELQVYILALFKGSGIASLRFPWPFLRSSAIIESEFGSVFSGRLNLRSISPYS